MIITFILLCAVVWLLFFSTSPFVGKQLLFINNMIEAKLAGLKYQIVNVDKKRFVFYSNSHKSSTPTMLLLHGFSADKSIWLKFAKYVHKDFNLIIPDLLGHGDNAFDSSVNYSAYTQARYVAQLIESLNVTDDIVVVGNSMGGMIGAILAQTNSDNTLVVTCKSLKSLILLDPAGARTEFAEKLAQEKMVPFEHSTMDSFYEFFNLTMNKPPFVPPSVLAHVAKHQYLDKRQQLRKMFLDFFNPDEFFSKPLNIGDVKALLIWGAEDKLLPANEANAWEQLVQCTPVYLNNIGHMPMVECPKIVADHIKERI